MDIVETLLAEILSRFVVCSKQFWKTRLINVLGLDAISQRLLEMLKGIEMLLNETNQQLDQLGKNHNS